VLHEDDDLICKICDAYVIGFVRCCFLSVRVCRHLIQPFASPTSTPAVLGSSPARHTVLSASGLSPFIALRLQPDHTFAKSGRSTLFPHRSWAIAAGNKARIVGPLDLLLFFHIALCFWPVSTGTRAKLARAKASNFFGPTYSFGRFSIGDVALSGQSNQSSSTAICRIVAQQNCKLWRFLSWSF
jgi:hypothetical protein